MGTMAFVLAVSAAAGRPNQKQQSIASPSLYPTIADLVRHERALHKNQPRTDMVWTNDNLPGTGGISVVGSPVEQAANIPSFSESGNSPGEEPRKAAEGTAFAQPTPTDRLKEATQSLEQARQKLASLRIDLNLAQRELTLDENQFDSNPNHPVDRGGEGKLRDDSRQVEEKQQAVTATENEVAELARELSQELLSAPRVTGTN
jgi:hypothetical protein